MTSNSKWISDYVDKADFTGLFVEQLGWDRPSGIQRTTTVEVEGQSFTLSEAASFKGIVVWTCPEIPSGQAQRAIDRALGKLSAERVAIFFDDQRQVWRWPQARA